MTVPLIIGACKLCESPVFSTCEREFPRRKQRCSAGPYCERHFKAHLDIAHEIRPMRREQINDDL